MDALEQNCLISVAEDEPPVTSDDPEAARAS